MQESSLLPAISGLVGVIVGAVLTALREYFFQRRSDLKDREYLAIQVSCQLERYVAGCVAVVADNGLYHGETDENDEYTAQAIVPKFEPELLKVEWKSLPVKLMHEVLDFPVKAEKANSTIDDAW